MKKIISLILVSCLVLSCMAGCGTKTPEPTDGPLELPLSTEPEVVETEPSTEPVIEETEPEIEEPVTPGLLVEPAKPVAFESWQDEWIGCGLPDNDENALISPLSLKMACLLAAAGAEGDTQTQLLDMFGYDNLDEFLSWGETVMGVQDALAVKSMGMEDGGVDDEGNFIGMSWGNLDGSTFKIANGIWHNTNEPGVFKDDYKARVERLSAAIEAMPGSELKDAINNWANEATNGLIPRVVGDEVAQSNNVLANALYLKASWINQFEGPFEEEDFTTKSGDVVKKTMMTQETKFRYYADEQCSLAILPMYDGFSMMVVKGDTYDIQNKMNQAEYTLLNLKMPKFEITYSAPDIAGLMKHLGVSDAFNPALADFKGMMDVDTFISSISQDSKIVVDENGVEAAAVTVMQMATSGLITEPPQPINFHLDEAFTFYIYYEMEIDGEFVPELLFYGEYNQ